MHAFIQVGRHWINLELVTSIELVEDKHNAADTIAARVHFSTGKHQDYKGKDDVAELVVFLTDHKAK